MNIQISKTAGELGEQSGRKAGALIREAIADRGQANVILATGTSQFATLQQLIREDIDWSRVVMFHLDEYIGLPLSHPASFRKYLQERFLDQVSPLKAVHLINGEIDPQAEIRQLSNLIGLHPIDVALAGIGENGHLAFNDPPADFETEEPYLIVNLDAACRRQQFNEGWFPSLEDVPTQAISMSVRQIMKSRHIICSVPDERKARAVKDTLEQPVSNLFPASILQSHPACYVYLDEDSARLLAIETGQNAG
ncbi:glucosamine-6-phosphate deaminase [Larkinella knui]|uniref:Glucosamine-6-phosphate deaminase n=1 Tax=Larkinella knui TaxID=2025310 RepID=A0A3P1CD85_9BACT|nr:glucosamine-6-phosphate deaminase [Larkinella knui]RRB11046.1 glucosamine-6-phosphate deaminase [Larkinella knui]